MVNGKIGDHPLTDIVSYGLKVFSPDVDAMVRELNDLGGFRNLIAHGWLLEQKYLLDTAREQGRTPYASLSMDEDMVLNGMRNLLSSELRRLKQEPH